MYTHGVYDNIINNNCGVMLLYCTVCVDLDQEEMPLVSAGVQRSVDCASVVFFYSVTLNPENQEYNNYFKLVVLRIFRFKRFTRSVMCIYTVL